MKTSVFLIFTISVAIIFVPFFSNGQTVQPVLIINESNCPLDYTVLCTSNDCQNVNSGGSGTIGGGSSTSVFCNTGDFAGLRFIYTNGDNVSRYITFNDNLDNQCKGIEECNSLYPWFLQGVESGCLGINGEIRADYFSEYDSCVIYFKIGF